MAGEFNEVKWEDNGIFGRRPEEAIVDTKLIWAHKLKIGETIEYLQEGNICGMYQFSRWIKVKVTDIQIHMRFMRMLTMSDGIISYVYIIPFGSSTRFVGDTMKIRPLPGKFYF